VTVWIALRKPRTITLRIYSGDVEGINRVERFKGTSSTVQIGDHLHVVAVTAKAAQSNQVLTRDQMHFYNLHFMAASGTEVPTTVQEHLNNPEVISQSISYEPYNLPSFALPPAHLKDLRITHASCRKPHGPNLDALPALDPMIKSTAKKLLERPHLLFLTGDQIYADDVADGLLLALTDTGDTLLGWEEKLPVDTNVNKKPKELKPGSRQEVSDTVLSSDQAKSHLFGIGEFYAMYLFAWSDVLWPLELPKFKDVHPDKDETVEQNLHGHGMSFKRNVPTPYFTKFQDEIRDLNNFKDSLPAIRKSLANIPTYMICDDHEITDDWYIHLDWCKKALSKPLGRRIIQNGLLAYALFQGWGNTPEQFENPQPGQQKPGYDILTTVKQWKGDIDDNEKRIATLLAIPDINVVVRDKLLRKPSDSSLYMHYAVKGTEYLKQGKSRLVFQIIVLDTRTWRRYPDEGSPRPSLLSDDAFDIQISDKAESTLDGVDITIVISPAPVIGAPIAEFGQSLRASFPPWEKKSILAQAADYESWGLQQSAFQLLFAKLPPQKAGATKANNAMVIFLSGDVHYGFAARMQYWATRPFKATTPEPIDVVFVQLTSSALKNETPPLTYYLHAMGYIPYANKLPKVKWAGWNDPPDPKKVKLHYPPESFLIPPHPWKIRQKPAMLDYSELDPLSQITVKPDWRYRIDFILAENDIRSPAPFNPQPVPPIAPTDDRGNALESYLAMAKNHKNYAEKWGNGKEIVGLNNIGEIIFSWPDDENKSVTQKLWWRLESDAAPSRLLEPFPLTRYTVSLNLVNPDYQKPILPGEVS
jgi:hypothetical protein